MLYFRRLTITEIQKTTHKELYQGTAFATNLVPAVRQQPAPPDPYSDAALAPVKTLDSNTRLELILE